MNIYNIIISFFILGLLASCGTDKKKEKDLVVPGEMLTSEALDTCLCNDLLIDSLTDQFIKNNTPYTGICIYNYPLTDTKYMVKSILDGKLHGKVSYYDKQGTLLMEEVYQNGDKKRSGTNAPIDCECSELTTKDNADMTYLDGIPFTGKCSEKYPNSDQLYLEIGYVNGLKVGFAIYYDRSGNTMYMEKYENNELIKVIHEVNN